MNNDLISRSELLAEFADDSFLLGCIVRRVIEDAPSANAQFVTHGRWIPVRDIRSGDMYGVKCNKCGRRVRNGGENYCPRCGAIMIGE